MKRSLVLALPAVFLAASLYAQSPINVGVKIGANLANVNLEETDPDVTINELKSQVGIVAGGFVRINLGKISIQPEILYSQKKLKDEEGGITTEYTSNEIDIPVLLGVDLIDAKVVKLRLMAGPQASLNLSNEITDFDGDVDELYESARFGFAAGVSLDVTKLTFDLRYNGSFGDVFDPEQFGVQGLESNANWVQFTVGFKFI